MLMPRMVASLRLPGGPRWGILIVLSIITVFCAALWIHGAQNHFVPCVMDCGETFVAKEQVTQYERHGFKYGLIQDHATSDDPSAHPFLYTHNVSLPGVLFPLLASVGLTKHWMHQFLTLAVSALGLFYVFRATAYYAQSFWVGWVMLLLFATDYLHVFGFALNALRAWHWLALFGLLFHLGRLCLEGHHAGRDRLAIGLLSLVAFGIGYDFFAICFFMSLAIVAFAGARQGKGRSAAWTTLFLAIVFALPVALRQLHVAAVLGTSFWWNDLVFSAGIKVPFLRSLIELPPIEEIDRTYREVNVVRAPATAAPDWAAIYTTLQDLVTFATVPSFGAVAIACAFLAIVAATFSVSGWLRMTYVDLGATRQANTRPLPRGDFLRSWRTEAVGGLHLLLVLTIGILAGLAFFAPLSLHIYLKHEFPLIAAPIILAKALVVTGLAALSLHLVQKRSYLRWLALGSLCFIVIDHAAIQLRHLKDRRPISTSWIPEVEARAASSFAVSWIADAVGGYTNSWAAGVTTGLENDFADRISHGHRLFEFGDYFLFGQKDRAAQGDEYLYPDYWLYFPTEHSVNFDKISPDCTGDHWGALWDRLKRIRKPVSVSGAELWVRRGSVFAPGSLAVLGGYLHKPPRGLARIEVRDGHRLVRALNYNCIYNSFAGSVLIDPTEGRSSIDFDVVAISDTAQEFRLGAITVSVSKDGPRFARSDLLPWSREPQPNIEKMVNLFPTLPVAVRGHDVVIFDLKGLRRPHSIRGGAPLTAPHHPNSDKR